MNKKTIYKNLITKIDDGWITIYFNRPESRNALSSELVIELSSLLNEIAKDDKCRGITFRGKGGIFCAGGDLKGFKSIIENNDTDAEAIKSSSQLAGKLFERINTMPQVVLMFVEGAAIAGGLGIVCSGDIVVVTEDSKFSLTETTLGITPAQIAPFIVQRLGLNTARKLMLTAASFTGKHALKNGLADHVVTDKLEFNKIESEIQDQVKRCAPKANAITKDLVLKASKLDKDQMIEYASEAFTQCILSDEGREGINAFLKKEKPKWAK